MQLNGTPEDGSGVRFRNVVETVRHKSLKTTAKILRPGGEGVGELQEGTGRGAEWRK